MKYLKKKLRFLKGWYRLVIKHCCPHCNSDARHTCPICQGVVRPFTQVDEDSIWRKFTKLLKNRFGV